MSKTKNYKNKKGGINIFVVLIAILVVLVAAILIVNGVQSSKINKIIGNYTEHVYGEREKVDMTYVANESYELWQSDKYIYDGINDIIYDYAYNTEVSETAVADVSAIVEAWGEEYSVANVQYSRYTDGSDVTKNYDELIVYSLSNEEGTVESADAAAELVWNLVTEMGDEYDFAGVIINVFDRTNEYSIVVDTLEKQPLTLDLLKAGTTKVEEYSSLYTSWLTSLEASEAEETVEGDVSEGEVSEGTVEETSEE